MDASGRASKAAMFCRQEFERVGGRAAGDASYAQDGECRAAGVGDFAHPGGILAGFPALSRFPLRYQQAHCWICVAGFSAPLIVREGV